MSNTRDKEPDCLGEGFTFNHSHRVTPLRPLRETERLHLEKVSLLCTGRILAREIRSKWIHKAASAVGGQ